MPKQPDELMKEALDEWDTSQSFSYAMVLTVMDAIRAHLAAEEGKQNIVDELVEALEDLLSCYANGKSVSHLQQEEQFFVVAKAALAKARGETDD